MRILVMIGLGLMLLAVAMAAASAECVDRESCETRCKHKCPFYEVPGCVSECISHKPPRCTPAPEGFHWPGCHDTWPDCVPPTLEDARTVAPGLTEDCFDRCNACNTEEAKKQCGHEPCGVFQCYHNCSAGHHPVCCHGC